MADVYIVDSTNHFFQFQRLTYEDALADIVAFTESPEKRKEIGAAQIVYASIATTRLDGSRSVHVIVNVQNT